MVRIGSSAATDTEMAPETALSAFIKLSPSELKSVSPIVRESSSGE